MSIADRRHDPRVMIDDDRQHWLELPPDLGAAREKRSLRIIEVAKTGLLVRLPADRTPADALPATNATLPGAHLLRPGGERHALTGLRVVGVRSAGGDDHATAVPGVAWLTSDDPAARALFWLTTQRAHGERGGEFLLHEPVPRDRLPTIPARGQYTEVARVERLNFVRRTCNVALANLQDTTLEAEKLTGNIEQMVGSVEIPVGIAGPLLFRGQKARGVIFAPMATTEGALVASACRGATAISRSGGVATRVISQRMMRVPLFVLTDMRGAYLFNNWVRDHVDEIRQQIREVSTHANLLAVIPNLIGQMVHVTFLYETGDAAGQNMTTSCTWHACQWLIKQVQHFREITFENFIIDANMSGDKKVNFRSFIDGRGTRVAAECFIDRETLQQVLKVTPDEIAATHQGALAGSINVGMIGYNINIANIIAAMFAATGQDIACVHESSLGQLTLRALPDGIYASMLLPSLVVGTVGGGTQLPRQRELLELMDCAGPGKVRRLAEIIAGFCLALDLSTLSAVASGQFALAHERLGRNRPVRHLSRDELDAGFFTAALREATGLAQATVTSVETTPDVQLGSSIITELTAHKVRKLVGHLPLRLLGHGFPADGDGGDGGNGGNGNGNGNGNGDGSGTQLDVLVKIKPLDSEVVLTSNALAANCGGKLAANYAKFKHAMGFAGCHTRELVLYQCDDERLRRITPRVYGVVRSDDREIYLVVLERLQNMVLMDSADDVSGWRPQHIETALRDIAQMHAIWYGREEQLREQPWLSGAVHTAQSMSEMIPLWESLGVHAAEEFPEWISQSDLALHRRFVRNIGRWWRQIEAMPRTLIHNDFNPRNICFRSQAGGGGLRLCAYDWELATLHLPQHDAAELLAFVLPDTTTRDEVDHYLEVHRSALQAAVGRPIDAEAWRVGYKLCLGDLAVNRFALYAMAHTFRHYGFMERATRTLHRLIDLAMRWRAA